jgi:hypothetical protein
MNGFIEAVKTFYHGEYEKQNKVSIEDLHRSKDQVGHFSKQVALDGCKTYEFSLGI